MRTFDTNKGYKIIDSVYRYKAIGLGVRELQRKTGFSSRHTLDLWLDRLRKLGILASHPKLPIRLTNASAQSYKNGTLVLPSDYRSSKALVRKKNDKNSNEILEKHRNVYLLILSISASGATYPRKATKFEPGQISSINIFKNEKISYRSYERPGVGLIDLVDKQKTRLDYLPPRRKNFGNGEMFGYISLTRSEAQQYLNILKNHDPPILRVIEHKSNGKNRYDIRDPLLKEFISFCIRTLHDVELKMQYVWLYKRPIKNFIKDDEKKWHIRLYGNEQRRRTLWLVQQKQKFRNADKSTQRENSLHADKKIHEFDKSIKQCYEVIMGQKYESVRRTYSLVTEPLIEVTCPRFLKAESSVV